MDKKSFVKGLFTGLGISLAGLIVAGGVISCNQKPVTTTPVVNKVDDERDDFRVKPRNVTSPVNWYIVGWGSNWPSNTGNSVPNGIPFLSSSGLVGGRRLVSFEVGDRFFVTNSDRSSLLFYDSLDSSLKGEYFGDYGNGVVNVLKKGIFDFSIKEVSGVFSFDVSLSTGYKTYVSNGTYPTSLVSLNSWEFCACLSTGSNVINLCSNAIRVYSSGSFRSYSLSWQSPYIDFYPDYGDVELHYDGVYSPLHGYSCVLYAYNLNSNVRSYFEEKVDYLLTGSSNYCSYSYTNNNDGTGYVDVTPDAGYSVNVNEWNDGTATYSGADYQRYESLGGGVYRLYFTGISVDGWSATFNANPSATQTIVYNLSHCTATPASVPYGDLNYHEVIRITPDAGYSLKHVVPVITGLSSNVYPAYTYYPQSDYIEIWCNQVGVNPSVTCSAIEKVDVNYDGLEHCSLLDVSPSPLVGYESRWRFVPDDGYNFLTGLTSPSWSVTPVSSVSWSTEYGEGEYLGKTILVCDATPNDGSMAFEVEASAGIPVISVLENLDGKELCYTDDEPLYWLNDNYRRLVTYHAKRGYRFVVPYIRTNVNVGLSYTLENGNKTLKVEYWNANSGVGVYQLTLMPQVGLEYEVIGLGSTNVDFGSSWRPIGYVDGNAGLYTGNSLDSNVLEFDSIVFSSNGNMYDKVRIVYKKIGNNRFYVDGTDINSDNHLANFYYFDHMDYVNSTNSESVVAVSTDVRVTQGASSAGAGYAEVAIYPETLYWGNSALKSISIYFDDGTTYDTAIGVGTGLTASQILLNGGNVTGGSSQGNTGNVGYGGTYDPFVLIATALGTATGFMGYMVLPGLTIGMLMLIPMIITLIIVVFRLVKK